MTFLYVVAEIWLGTCIVSRSLACAAAAAASTMLLDLISLRGAESSVWTMATDKAWVEILDDHGV